MKKRILAVLTAAAFALCVPAAVWAEETDTEETGTAAETESKESDKESEETVLVDDENCTFTITSYEPDSLWGYGLQVHLENKSDRTLMFSLNDVSVNGCMADPFWASEVAAGKKDKTEIDFYTSDLEKYGITDVTEITLTLRVYDSEDWTADDFVNETFTVYPLGEEAAIVQEREDQDTDEVLVDDENFRILVIGYDPEDLFGYSMMLYIENKTDKQIMFGIDDAAVNGYMSDPYWASEIPAGKREITDVTWYQSDLDEKEIETVEELSFTLTAHEADDYSADYLLNESVTLNP